MVDCGQSYTLDKVLADLSNHKLWRSAYEGRVRAYVWYVTDTAGTDIRRQLANRIRERYNPWCSRQK
jgi:hypothetical protein